MINDMETKDFTLLFEQLFNTEGYSKDGEYNDWIGEKDFFEFIKRANRDLTPHQRYVILNTAIKMIKQGESDDR